MKTITLMILGLEAKNIKNTKNLSYLISKASRKKSSTDYLEIISDYLHLPLLKQTSIAELTALYDGFVTKESHWLRADPVELKADLAAVYMFGNQHLHLTTSQLETIRNKIQPLLDDYKIKLHTTEKNRWYLQCLEPLTITTVAHETIIGKDVINFLPQSKDKINWARLQTEIQMTLFQLTDNGGVNSLWFWGEGKKLTKMTAKENYQLFSNEPVSCGVAMNCKMSRHKLPKLLTEETFWQNLIEGENLLVYDTLASSRSQADFTEYLQELDQQFIQPLLVGLKNHKIDKIDINFLNGSSYQFKRINSYFFWRYKMA